MGFGGEFRSENGGVQHFSERLAGATLLALVLLAAPAAFGASSLRESSELQLVTPMEVRRILASGEGPVVIDARSAGEYSQGHVPGALNFPHKETWGRIDELRQYEERGIIYYCTKGGRAKIAANGLLVEGFRKVGLMTGHVHAWQELGYPLARGNEPGSE
jgi:rhodanese-related sulfurtransferase